MRFVDAIAPLVGDSLLDPHGECVPVIVADNIARQIDAMDQIDDSNADWPAAAFGRVAPPFPVFWVEATTELVPTGETERFEVRRGALVADMSWTPETMEPMVGPATWYVTLAPFIQWRAKDGRWGPIWGYNGRIVIGLDEEGRLLRDLATATVIEGAMFGPSEGVHVLPREGAAHHAPWVMMSISALHRGVPVELVEPSPPSRQARRLHERRTGQPLEPEHSYYVLMVKPTRPGTFEEIAAPESHIHVERRQHVVRGHFRWYGERGMFGRADLANRLVWVPAHERGHDGLGTIRKDYKVPGE